MYRKLFILATMALMLVSCRKEEGVGDVELQLCATIQSGILPLSKAAEPETVIADHAVFQAWCGNVCAAEVEQDIEPGTKQIYFNDVKLAGGYDYDIYIWVDKKGYYNTNDLREVKLSADKSCIGPSKEFDAFYAYTTVHCEQNTVIEPITLKRPFALINFSATGLEDVQIQFDAPDCMNLKTGELSIVLTHKYTVSKISDGIITAFDYVFAPDGGTEMDYSFMIGPGGEEKIIKVPVYRNRRTNIIYNAN